MGEADNPPKETSILRSLQKKFLFGDGPIKMNHCKKQKLGKHPYLMN
jgi:hypothetical protein